MINFSVQQNLSLATSDHLRPEFARKQVLSINGGPKFMGAIGIKRRRFLLILQDV